MINQKLQFGNFEEIYSNKVAFETLLSEIKDLIYAEQSVAASNVVTDLG